MREADKAIEWLERAHRIDPGDGANNANLSAYHAYKDDYEKSRRFAEASLHRERMWIRQDNISKRFKSCLGRHAICCSR